MSHLAIARKWRPQVFEDIVGQRHVTRTLQNAIRLGRVHHAFLFTGARGVGKTSAARVLARALNCEQGPGPNPCNECSSCKEMLSGSYPDVVEIDAASHNSVDDIRDLVDKSRYTPQRGRFKVYIIDEVHMVTKQGFNALLKTLEEPPPHVRFILATTDPQKLLDTVISRCQRFDFKMIPVRTIYEHIKHVADTEGVGIPEGALMTIAREGGGSMRDAQSLLDQVLSFTEGSVTDEEVAEILGFIDRSILYEALEGAIEGDPGKALEVLGRVRLYGYDTRAFSGQLLEAVRNVLVVRLVEDAAKLMDLPDQEISRLRALAKGRDPSLLRQQFDVLAETVDAITRSEQPMLLLETALVKMASIRPFVPIEQLLSRLESLEQRLARAGVRPGGGGGAGGGGRASGGALRRETPSRPEPSFRASRPEPVPKTEFKPQPARQPAPPKPQPKPQPKPDFKQKATARPAPGGSMVSSILGYQRADMPRPSAPSPKPETKETKAEPPQARSKPTPHPEPAPAPQRAEPPPRGPTPSRPVPTPRAPAVRAPMDRPAHQRSRLLSDLSNNNDEGTAQIVVVPDRPDPSGGEVCDAQKWRRFVHSLSSDETMSVVRGMLARSGYMSETGNTVTIGFYSAVTLRNAVTEMTDDVLGGALKDYFGAAVAIEPVLDTGGVSGRSLAEELDRLRAIKRDELRRDALAHPAITAAQELFPGASIIGEPRIPTIEEIHDVQ